MNDTRDGVADGYENMERGSTQPEYKGFRKDGWPLCPQCGEDELQNHMLTLKGLETPSLGEFLRDGLKCLACHWESKNWKAHYR